VGTLAVALSWAGAAAVATDDAAERARIERDRADVQQRASTAERACADRFLVASCLKQARTERRAALQQLDHQRALLDDAQRKERAAQRQARIQQRQEAQAREDEQRPVPVLAAQPPQAQRDTAAVQSPVARSAPATPRRQRTDGAPEAARRAEASKRRAEEAAAHRMAVEQRNREQAARRSPQPSLPLPGASAPAR
jgi:hypothetical protein